MYATQSVCTQSGNANRVHAECMQHYVYKTLSYVISTHDRKCTQQKECTQSVCNTECMPNTAWMPHRVYTECMPHTVYATQSV